MRSKRRSRREIAKEGGGRPIKEGGQGKIKKKK